jgi:hypothetical protein
MKTTDELEDCYEYIAEQATIEKVKLGDFLKLKDSETAPVWVRDEYCRFNKKYRIYKFEDINHDRYIKKGTKVYIGFTF